MRNFDDRAERLKVVPHGYKKIVDVCGSKWPRNLPVIAAAAYMGMSERRFRAEPQLAGLIQLQFGVEIVDKVQLDLLQDELSFGASPAGSTTPFPASRLPDDIFTAGKTWMHSSNA